MDWEADWNSIRGERASFFGMAGAGILRATLLFGSVAVALALILAPIADNQTRQLASGGVDRMSTGSVSRAPSGYTIRRSVLQDSPTAICIIRNDGTRSGDCN